MRQMVKGTHLSEAFTRLESKKKRKKSGLKSKVVEGPFSDF